MNDEFSQNCLVLVFHDGHHSIELKAKMTSITSIMSPYQDAIQ